MLSSKVQTRVLSLAVPRWKRVTSATDQLRKGADSNLPGWQPKETASQLPQGRGTLETAWVASVHTRRGAPKTPVREGEGTRGPWRRGATGCCRLSRQLLVCGQGLQRGESVDNAYALAEHLSLCPAVPGSHHSTGAENSGGANFAVLRQELFPYPGHCRGQFPHS